MIRSVLSLVVVAVLLVSCGVAGGDDGVGTFSSGLRTGVVVKLSEKGTAIKSYEGELLLGGLPVRSEVVDGERVTNVVSPLWSFSVAGDDADAVYAQLTEVLRTGERVVLHYRQARIRGLTDTEYYIERVERIDRDG